MRPAHAHDEPGEHHRAEDRHAQPQVPARRTQPENHGIATLDVGLGQYVTAEHEENAHGELAVPQHGKWREADHVVNYATHGVGRRRIGVDEGESARQEGEEQMAEQHVYRGEATQSVR
jgi:hypothetical protein